MQASWEIRKVCLAQDSEGSQSVLLMLAQFCWGLWMAMTRETRKPWEKGRVWRPIASRDYPRWHKGLSVGPTSVKPSQHSRPATWDLGETKLQQLFPESTEAREDSAVMSSSGLCRGLGCDPWHPSVTPVPGVQAPFSDLGQVVLRWHAYIGAERTLIHMKWSMKDKRTLRLAFRVP